VKTRISHKNRQSGVALIALLMMLILAAGYAFYRNSNLDSARLDQRETILLRLAQAKDALITYAVTDATRPGRLLCPDLIGNGVSPLLARDDCDAYGGLLPGNTLGLRDYTDNNSQPFYYYLSPSFGGKHVTPPLNSETTTTLHLDVPTGGASNDIAAIIIAPRGPLDTKNADGDDYFFSGTSDDPSDNDLVIAITRQELMAATEQRVANELRTCLEQHAASPDNLQHTYPWPAPLSNSAFQGKTGSLFGMVPDTQSGNPQQALKDSITKLTNIQNSLKSPSTAAGTLTSLQQLQDAAAYARALFDRLYLVALALNTSALQANAAFSTLDNTIASVTASKPSFTANGSTLPAAFGAALPSLNNFQAALADSGFDIFLTELQNQDTTLNQTLSAASVTPNTATLNALLTSVNEFNNRLLNYAWTPNTALNALIDDAFNASTTAATSINTAKKSLAAPAIQQAITDTQALYADNLALAAAITASRVNIDPAQLAYQAQQINALQQALSSTPDTSSIAALVAGLNSAQTLLNSANKGGNLSAAITSSLANSQSAVNSALAAANASSQLGVIQSTASQSSSALTSLSTLIAANGDLIATETLKNINSSLAIAANQAPANVTAARALRTPVKTVIYWSDIAANQADDVATLSRKGIINGTPAIYDSDSSAYVAASHLLNSLDGSTGTITALSQSIAKPDDSALAAAASNAIASTQALLSNLLTVAQQLNGQLNTSQANAAVPVLWFSNACALLRPSTGSDDTWWTANGWKSLFFYQISNQVRPAIGNLKINGNGSYRFVVISAGRALPGQNRLTRQSVSFLEGKNADPSRDGDATSPVGTFFTAPISPSFNDHLAY
jgi:hypothetical protein